ncbi:unnamed protein product [Pylaiella littoralis]
MKGRNVVDIAGRGRQPPEWVVFVLAVTADISYAAGFVPLGYLAVVRSLLMYCLYREWVLALICGFALPRFVPLSGVCFLKQKWLAFTDKLEVLTVEANERRAATTAAAAASASAANAPDVQQADVARKSSSSQRKQQRARGEVSGYDVSAVSGDEVVEISSWKTQKASSGRGDVSGARRRGPR